MFHWAPMESSDKNHVLIIDDSIDQQMLLKMLLESKGYTTECTSNGAEALRLLHSSGKMPQTIILDLNMPIMNGFDFRKLQREDPMLKNIPLVVVSGDGDITSTRTKMTSAEVLVKPFSVSDLFEALERNCLLN